MRVIHTSDWHLGRTFHGASLAAEQAAAVDALVDLVRAERAELVIVAGDLYDRQLPPVDAISLLSHALSELRAAGAAVVAIAGNHDSGRRLGFAGGLLDTAGVHLRGDVRSAGSPVLIPAGDGGTDVAVYPIPYLEPEVARHALAAPQERTHDALLRLALDRSRADLAARGPLRAIAVAHAFVAGGAPSDSERALSVGGSDRVGLGCLRGFDYVALGHLHGRQSMAGGRVRYAGSPLPYSFSERDHVKGVWVLDLPPSGPPRVAPVDLSIGRRLAVVSGELEALLADRRHARVEDHWLAVTLTDPVLPRDAMARLRRRFPHAVTLAHEPPAGAGGGRTSYNERVRDRDDLTLVDGFLAHVTGRGLTAPERSDCATVLDEVARDEAA